MKASRRWALLAASVLFGLALGEIASRVALRVAFRQPLPLAKAAQSRSSIAAGGPDLASEREQAARQLTQGTSLHPFLGYVQTPRPIDRRWLDHHRFPINDFGFIDDKPAIQRRDPRRLLVGITGGSMAYFFSAEGADRLAERLAAMPAFAGREVVFVRLAQGGFKQPQQLATLTYLLAVGGELDLLINLDGFNEIALYPVEGAPARAFPAFPRGWPKQIDAIASPARQRALGKWAVFSDARMRWAKAARGRLADRSALLTLAWLAGDRWIVRRANDALARFDDLAARGPLSFSATGPPTTFATRDAMLDGLAALWERSTLQMGRLSKANGIGYFAFLQPNQYGGPKPMSPQERALAIDEKAPHAALIRDGYPRLRAAGERLRAAGVAWTDLTQIYAQVEEPLYEDSCCHVSEEGSRRMADAVADEITSYRPAR
jgi:hypothetical protein